MTTLYEITKRQEQVSLSGAIGIGSFTLWILATQSTSGVLLWVLISGLVSALSSSVIAAALDENWVGGVLGSIVGIGITAVGRLEVPHEGLFWSAVAVGGACGIITLGATMCRFKSWGSTPIGASLGAVVAGLVLYGF